MFYVSLPVMAKTSGARDVVLASIDLLVNSSRPPMVREHTPCTVPMGLVLRRHYCLLTVLTLSHDLRVVLVVQNFIGIAVLDRVQKLMEVPRPDGDSKSTTVNHSTTNHRY